MCVCVMVARCYTTVFADKTEWSSAAPFSVLVKDLLIFMSAEG